MFSIRIFHMLPFVDAFSSHLNGPIAKNVHAPLGWALPLQQLRKEMKREMWVTCFSEQLCTHGSGPAEAWVRVCKGILVSCWELQGLCSPPPGSARTWMPGPVSSAQKVLKKPRNCSSHQKKEKSTIVCYFHFLRRKRWFVWAVPLPGNLAAFGEKGVKQQVRGNSGRKHVVWTASSQGK